MLLSARRNWLRGILFLVVFTFVTTFGWLTVTSISAQDASPVASPVAEATAPPVRQVLATGQSPELPGQSINLVRYNIPAGLILPVHVHPGVQMAWVEAGELTYHVLKGEVQIGRAADASASGPGATTALKAGESTVLTAGDWVIEVAGAVHYGENLGTETVVLWATTVLETGSPASIPVNDEGTPVAS